MAKPIPITEVLDDVTAERDALLAACEAIHEVMYVKNGVDWNCRMCGGYNYTKETVAHGMECPVGRVQAAIAKAAP